MKERLNTSLQSTSLILVVAGIAWVVWSRETTLAQMLTYLLIIMIFIEILSLYLISRIYPESHTSFKMGIIAALLIMFGVKIIFPLMFAQLTIFLFACNFLYNFYTNSKRRKGAFKRKRPKRAR